MDKPSLISDLVSALEEEVNTFVRSNASKGPLRTNKQRNISNNHRKSKLTAAAAATGSKDVKGLSKSKRSADNNSTDDDDEVRQHPSASTTGGSGGGSINADEEGHEKCQCEEGGGEDQSGYVDSDQNITERLCCLSKLSLHGEAAAGVGISSVGGASSSAGACGGAGCIKTVLKKHSTYPALLPESDSFNEVQTGKYQPAPSNCPGEGGAIEVDCAEVEGASGTTPRRCRRRRRRRGHNNKKRMAVDTSPGSGGNNNNQEEDPIDFNIRPIRTEGVYGAAERYYKMKTTLDSKFQEPLLIDNYGMKRKRNFMGSHSKASASGSSWGNIEMGEGLSSLSSAAAVHMDDEEMKSDDDDGDYSTSADEEDEEDDTGREADDEQSDWVSDEWNTSANSSSQEDASLAISRKKRIMNLLQNYNSAITAGRGGTLCTDDQIVSREILAGKRRVLNSKPVFPSRSIWTSANEEVSKFLQDPLQSQLRLQPVSMEEQVQLSHLASLYSLRMDYCSNNMEVPPREMMAPPDVIGTVPDLIKLCPVLTKTPNTTQMDKNNPLHALSLLQGECSSSSTANTSILSPPCPTLCYSDVDSTSSDTKRIKK